MKKIFDSLIKITIVNKFDGNKKIEVAGGKNSEGFITLSTPLETKTIDLSTSSTRLQDRKANNKKLKGKIGR